MNQPPIDFTTLNLEEELASFAVYSQKEFLILKSRLSLVKNEYQKMYEAYLVTHFQTMMSFIGDSLELLHREQKKVQKLDEKTKDSIKLALAFWHTLKKEELSLYELLYSNQIDLQPDAFVQMQQGIIKDFLKKRPVN